MSDNQLTVFDFWDVQNPRSIVNIVPPNLADYFREAYLKEPDLFGREERDLRTLLKSQARAPTSTDNRIRLNFWYAYEKAQNELKPLAPSTICSGICDSRTFGEKYMKLASRVAWMLTPIAEYEAVVRENLQYGMEKFRDILEMDETLPNGQTNMKLLELKVKIIALMDLRMKGLPTQKIEQKNLTFTMHHASKSAGAALTELSMEALEKRLKDLTVRERKAQNVPEVEMDPPGDSGAGAPGPAVGTSQAIDVEFKSV